MENTENLTPPVPAAPAPTGAPKELTNEQLEKMSLALIDALKGVRISLFQIPMYTLPGAKEYAINALSIAMRTLAWYVSGWYVPIFYLLPDYVSVGYMIGWLVFTHGKTWVSKL